MENEKNVQDFQPKEAPAIGLGHWAQRSYLRPWLLIVVNF